MKTMRILAVMGVVCTLVAGVALADLRPRDFLGVANFPDVEEVAGVDALANGDFLVLAEGALYQGDKDADDFAQVWPSEAEAKTIPADTGGFVAALENAQALVGLDDTLWLFDLDAEDVLVGDIAVAGDASDAVYGEYLGDSRVLITRTGEGVNELGILQFAVGVNTAAVYTKVVEGNTPPLGAAVLLGDTVYVGAGSEVRAFALSALLGEEVPEKDMLSWDDGELLGDDFLTFGPTSARRGALLVSGLTGFQIVQITGAAVPVGFGGEDTHVAIYNAASDKVLVVNIDNGTAQIQSVSLWQRILRWLLPIAGILLLLLLIFGFLL